MAVVSSVLLSTDYDTSANTNSVASITERMLF